MARTCPNCTRTLTDPGPGDPAAFCMYCGQRLRPDPLAGPDSAAVLTAAYEPVDSESPVSGPDSADVITRALISTPEPPSGRVNTARPPAEIGGYRLIRCLGTGGMGAVYEAVAADGETQVAVKLLSGKLADNPTSVERFKQEGRVASQIVHPRCVFVIDADTDAGRPYIVMELMPGTTLKDLVDKRGPLPPIEAVARILDVIDGLDEAHRLGVIHRDVKPSNCFLTADDRVKVGDFGLSKSLGTDREAGQLTQTGAFLGTVLFASPEQIRGEPVGYESDVYAVCATLYYLLVARAPHQHTSLTGALAKAISEPPRPTRSIRPGVPASLDRVLLRGLERDRSRRWTTLVDLRDALRDQLPATHTPARRRALSLAYAADAILLQFVAIPLELLADPTSDTGSVGAWWLSLAVSLGYFSAADGVFGTTIGKQLLRLRVARVGETGPPGVGRGFLRAAVFHLLLFVGLTGFGMIFDDGIGRSWRAIGASTAVIAFSGMAVQLRRTPAGFRGLHDLAAGCHTLLRPRPPERVRLASRFPNPLDMPRQSRVPLPTTVGGFAVVGVGGDLADGGQVWVGEDKSLGRRVLIRVGGPGQDVTGSANHAAARPARLRPSGQGELAWDSAVRGWVGYVAPSGSPLTDVIDPARPLGWADARPILEQLTDELTAAEADGTAIERPNIAQVWIEPGGRLQLLDVPLPTGAMVAAGRSAAPDAGPSDSLVFVREVAALLLEGKPRGVGGHVKAPVPPHAAAVVDKLFSNGPAGFTELAELRAALTETHSHPPRVTRSMRVAHLGVQAAMLSAGLMLMFAAAGLYSWVLAVSAAIEVAGPERLRTALADPTQRSAVLAAARQLPDGSEPRALLEAALAPGQLNETVGRLDVLISTRHAELEKHRRRLTRPEKKALDRLREQAAGWEPTRPDALTEAGQHLTAALIPTPSPGPVAPELFTTATVLVLGVPLIWAGFAFVFRGGLAMALAGITLVRADGTPASRVRCAVRELVVWLPVTGLLLTGLWVQAVAPSFVAVRTALWLAAALLLPVYALVALRNPARPPQDLVVGTVLVPV